MKGRAVVFRRGTSDQFLKCERALAPVHQGLGETSSVVSPRLPYHVLMSTELPPRKPEIHKGLRKLGDLFQSQGDNFITRFDRSVIRLVSGASGVFQEATGVTHKEQLSLVWGFAMATSAVDVFCSDRQLTDKIFGVMAMTIAFRHFRNPPILTPLEEEMNWEAKGVHKDLVKYFRAVGLFVVAKNLFLPDASIEGMTLLNELGEKAVDASTFLFTLAFYLMLANVPKPPKKPWLDKVWDEAKATLEGLTRPSPEPVRVPVYIPGDRLRRR